MAAMGITEWLFWNSILIVMTIAAIRAKKFPSVAVLTLISLLIMWQHVAYVDVYYRAGISGGTPISGLFLNNTVSYIDSYGRNITEYRYSRYFTDPDGIKLGTYYNLASADEIVYVYIAWTCILLINLASRLEVIANRRRKT